MNAIGYVPHRCPNRNLGLLSAGGISLLAFAGASGGAHNMVEKN